MIRWLSITILVAISSLLVVEAIARDPYNPTGFPTCQGGETGFWQFVVRDNPTRGEKPLVSLVLTTVDVADPAFVVCWVDGTHRITAVGPEKRL